MSEEEPGKEFRLKGNEAFVKKNYEEAEGLYSEAIKVGPNNHLAFGNRSAARLGLGRNEEALADALEALRLDPTYLKAYHRKACAQKALGNIEGMVEAYKDALKVEPLNDWARKQLRNSRKEYAKFLRKHPIECLEDWAKLFNSLEDPRERMLQLAEFWNNSSPEERLSIFNRFLAIISGANMTEGFGHEEFTIEKMVELPMENYEDMERNEGWIEFYRTKDSETKLSIFEKTWELTTDQEKTIIVNDLKHFFLVPVLKEKGSIASDDDEEEEEDDEDKQSSSDK